MADGPQKTHAGFRHVQIEQDFMGSRVRVPAIDYSGIVPKEEAKGKVSGVDAVGISMRYIDPNKDGKLTFEEMQTLYGKNARPIFDFLRLDMVRKYPPDETMETEVGTIRTWEVAWLKLAVDLIAWKHGVESPNESFEPDDDVTECVPPAQETLDCERFSFQLSQISAGCYLKSLAFLDHQIERFLAECKPGMI